MTLTIFSFGGGVQSMAALVLAAQGDLACDAFLFANVGDDSEHPATLRYVHDVAMPYAAAHGVALHELRKTRRMREPWKKALDRQSAEEAHARRWQIEPETVLERLMRPGSRSIGIPVRMSNGAPGRRACTTDFKVRLIARWCRECGATPAHPATTMLGISLDEFQRMRNDSGIAYTRLAYPLIDRRMTRQDCINVIAGAGLPVPPKSSCWFCPFHTLTRWHEMHDREPELFARAVALERHINDKRARLGRDQVWLSGALKPLDKAVGDVSQPSLFADVEDACESGFCMV